MSSVFASTPNVRMTAATPTFGGWPQPTQVLMRNLELAYSRKKLGICLVRATAATFALIFGLMGNAEQRDPPTTDEAPERFDEELERDLECLSPATVEKKRQCAARLERFMEEHEEQQRERWRSQCVGDANPDQCLSKIEAREALEAEELTLIFFWLYGVFPKAETKAVLEFKAHTITRMQRKLYFAGFRLCPAIRQAVKSRLDRLQEIRALDDTAADAYLDKLLTGFDPTLPRIPSSCP